MRLAIATPWFGRELIGGAERLAWDLSQALKNAGSDIEVLTTCCRSFHDDWAANYHRPGSTVTNGITVRRFRVNARDRVAFSRANSALLALRREQLRRDRPPLPEEKTGAFISQSIHSQALVRHLQQSQSNYDAVIFLPYLYGTTIDGLPIVPEKAFLLPCLHDEAYAYLDTIRAAFRSAKGLLFNSDGELAVAANLYGPWIHARGHVIGHAVDVIDVPAEPAAIKGFMPHRSRYILYLGRGDRTKNLELAVDAYATFREQRRVTALQFVVAGPHARHLRTVEGVVDLGPVTEQAKAALLAHARALVQPSTNESFSRTVYEAWHARRPVVVHGDCQATATAVQQSGGGWIASTTAEWADILVTIDEASDEFIDGLGHRGRAAALEAGTWKDVAARTLTAISETLDRFELPRIEQVVPLGSKPAAQHAAALDSTLRRAGYPSTISIEGAAPAQAGATLVRHMVERGDIASADLIIAHSGDIDSSARSPIFAATPEVAELLSEKKLLTRLLPAPVDPEPWANAIPEKVRFDDGVTNIVSIATLTIPEAEALLRTFALFRRRVYNSRLLVSGEACNSAARTAIERLSAELGLEKAVVLVGDEISARYAALRDAHVAVAFGASLERSDALVEALWFDLPVAAVDNAVSRGVVETCGILFDGDDHNEAAAVLFLLATDRDLRFNVIVEGRRVRARYSPRNCIRALLDVLTTGSGEPRRSSIRP
jgi:glycosyltransferase involved in cell wall biosynthesis